MIRLEHTGACFIMIDGKGYVPGDLIETEVLSAGIKQLIAEGRLTLADDPKESKKIAEVLGNLTLFLKTPNQNQNHSSHRKISQGPYSATAETSLFYIFQQDYLS